MHGFKTMVVFFLVPKYSRGPYGSCARKPGVAIQLNQQLFGSLACMHLTKGFT
jgi:hypothetical protein